MQQRRERRSHRHGVPGLFAGLIPAVHVVDLGNVVEGDEAIGRGGLKNSTIHDFVKAQILSR